MQYAPTPDLYMIPSLVVRQDLLINRKMALSLFPYRGFTGKPAEATEAAETCQVLKTWQV
jgi:hypothetical protein